MLSDLVPQIPLHQTLLLIPMLAPLSGARCNSSERRLAELAEQSRAQAVRHNEQLVQQAQVVAETSRTLVSASQELVEQDAAARRELLQAQGNWAEQQQLERKAIAAEQRALQDERRAAAVAAVRDPVVAQAVISGCLALTALLPLLVALYALARMPTRELSDDLENEPLLAAWLDHPAGLPAIARAPVAGLEASPAALAEGNGSAAAAAGPP